ncbi:MAG TPA: type II toxin-antitoxin system VapC family toxin [Candidatus Thermoplasmatota archaeon]|nr:type II toxin-antitoxin system VapC family toxin [Candidatus Thermoplasmatota archaeon]
MNLERTFVLDASAAIRAAREEEEGCAEAQAAMLAALGAGYEPIAPDLFAYEVGHASGRGSPRLGGNAPLLLATLQMPRFVQLTPALLVRVQSLAHEARISFYDASYVALAEAARTWLWTEDKDLARKFPDIACSGAGVPGRVG